MGLEASTAVDRPIILGNERDLGGRSALGTNGIVHFALAAALGFTGVPACLAADGLVLETLLSVEFLLTGSKNELSAAILAYQSLVFEHGEKSPCKNIFRLSHLSADLVFAPTLAAGKVRY
ncbi:hypothetical protein SDC9_176933 [bioreactor metagenome]|uniref:Uncharacterized protein n=1 Tax=bioreactor metagenome TaxID=1076179 RepID=A0A645GT65_9ZZZZ